MKLKEYVDLILELMDEDPHIPEMDVKFPDDNGNLISMDKGCILKKDNKGEWYCSVTGR